MKKSPGRKSRRFAIFKGIHKLDRTKKMLRAAGQESKIKSNKSWEKIREAQERNKKKRKNKKR